MSVEAKVSDLLYNELQQLRQDIVSGLEQAGKTATGSTAAAIQVVVNGEGAQLQAPSHLLTLENGRGPARGSSSDKQQFINNLKTWIVAKGISYKDENDLQRLAGFFRWYINKFGTKQYRQGQQYDIITPAIERFKEKVNSKIADLHSAEVANLVSIIFQ